MAKDKFDWRGTLNRQSKEMLRTLIIMGVAGAGAVGIVALAFKAAKAADLGPGLAAFIAGVVVMLIALALSVLAEWHLWKQERRRDLEALSRSYKNSKIKENSYE